MLVKSYLRSFCKAISCKVSYCLNERKSKFNVYNGPVFYQVYVASAERPGGSF